MWWCCDYNCTFLRHNRKLALEQGFLFKYHHATSLLAPSYLVAVWVKHLTPSPCGVDTPPLVLHHVDSRQLLPVTPLLHAMFNLSTLPTSFSTRPAPHLHFPSLLPTHRPPIAPGSSCFASVPPTPLLISTTMRTPYWIIVFAVCLCLDSVISFIHPGFSASLTCHALHLHLHRERCMTCPSKDNQDGVCQIAGIIMC